MRTRTTFCIIAVERRRHGRVIVNTPVPVLGNDATSLLGAGEEGSNLKWLKHNLSGIEIEVPDQFFDQVSYYVAKIIACNLAAPNMRVERTRRRFLSYSSACTCRSSMRGRSR